MAKKKEWPVWTLIPAYVVGAWFGFYGRRIVSEKVVAYRLQRVLKDCSLLNS